MPVYVGPVNAAQQGVYLTASPDFVGSFVLQETASGYQAGGLGGPTTVLSGDDKFLTFAPPVAVAQTNGCNGVTLAVTSYTAGNLTLSVVQ